MGLFDRFKSSNVNVDDEIKRIRELTYYKKLDEISKITDEKVLIALTKYKSQSGETDVEIAVRSAAARNPHLKNKKILDSLARGSADILDNENVLVNAMSNPNMSQKTLENIAFDVNAKGRYDAIRFMTNKKALT